MNPMKNMPPPPGTRSSDTESEAEGLIDPEARKRKPKVRELNEAEQLADDEKRRPVMQAKIQELEAKRENFLRSYREEFKKVVADRERADQERETVTRLNLDGRISDDDLAATELELAERITQSDRIANRFKEDALEVDKEIQKLKDEVAAIDSRLSN